MLWIENGSCPIVVYVTPPPPSIVGKGLLKGGPETRTRLLAPRKRVAETRGHRFRWNARRARSAGGGCRPGGRRGVCRCARAPGEQRGGAGRGRGGGGRTGPPAESSGGDERRPRILGPCCRAGSRCDRTCRRSRETHW